VRVVLISERFSPSIGGVEAHVMAIAKHLAAAGLEPTVVTGERSAGVRSDGNHDKLPYAVRRAIGIPGLVRAFRSASPQIVHLHGGRAPLAARAALVCRWMSIPFVITPHCFYPPKSGWDRLRKALYDRAVLGPILRRSRAVIALTQVDRRDAVDRGAREESVIEIPNCVDIDLLSSRREAAMPAWWDEKLRYVCSVGRLDPVKRFDLLLEAFGSVASSDDRLVIAGPDAGAGASLRRLAHTLGLAERVVFAGAVSDELLLRIYKRSYLFVLPSAFEGLPTVVLEAMVLGAPVLTSDAGGTPTLIRHGHNGYLFHSGDIGDLKQTLAMILKDGVPTVVTANAGRDVRSRYSWAVNAARLHRLYEQCVGMPISGRSSV
jgi:glycosyltransferase involved in cell wall biosynthesis